VRFVRDSLSMVRDMLLVRWRGLTGAYDRELDGDALQDLMQGGADGAPAAVEARAARALGKSG
jgi:pantothenate kinase-related protein Tda10